MISLDLQVLPLPERIICQCPSPRPAPRSADVAADIAATNLELRASNYCAQGTQAGGFRYIVALQLGSRRFSGQ